MCTVLNQLLPFLKTHTMSELERMYILEAQAYPLYINCLELAQVLQREDWREASWQIPSLLQRMIVKRHIDAHRGIKYLGYEKALRLARPLNL